MPRCTSPQPYTGSSGSNYGSLHYPPPQSDDRLRRLMLHDVSAPAESAVATDAFSVAAVSTSDGMSVILTGATAVIVHLAGHSVQQDQPQHALVAELLHPAAHPVLIFMSIHVFMDIHVH